MDPLALSLLPPFAISLAAIVTGTVESRTQEPRPASPDGDPPDETPTGD